MGKQIKAGQVDAAQVAKDLRDILNGKVNSPKVIHVDFGIKHTAATKAAMKSKVVKVSRITSSELKSLIAQGFVVIVT